MTKLLTFLSTLEAVKIHYTLAHHRDETMMVCIAIPGERWEVEFFVDGSVEVEIFRSIGMKGEEVLARLFEEDEQG